MLGEDEGDRVLGKGRKGICKCFEERVNGVGLGDREVIGEVGL